MLSGVSISLGLGPDLHKFLPRLASLAPSFMTKFIDDVLATISRFGLLRWKAKTEAGNGSLAVRWAWRRQRPTAARFEILGTGFVGAQQGLAEKGSRDVYVPGVRGIWV